MSLMSLISYGVCVDVMYVNFTSLFQTGQTGLKPLDEMSVLPSTLVLSDAATEPVIPSSNSYHNSEARKMCHILFGLKVTDPTADIRLMTEIACLLL